MNAETGSKLRILCVDDEPQILEGLALHLRRRYLPMTATCGAAALELLAQHPDTAVVISDMRMPGMNGAAFLAQSRLAAPSAVRMLLTGQSDINSAIAAINDGQIFRFLTKPCTPQTLLDATSAAVAQHELIIAEKVLLEQTLRGSIQALVDVLALVNPVSFGRAARIKQLVIELATQTAMNDRWQVEVAAMLSQLGHITLPAATAEKVYYGRELSSDEKQMVTRLPAVTEELLGNIPRMEGVREILRTYSRPYAPGAAPRAPGMDDVIHQSVNLLTVAIAFDALDSSDIASPQLIIEQLRCQVGKYAPDMLDALDALKCHTKIARSHQVPGRFLRIGMTLAEDVHARDGTLLVARGYQITERFLERIRNLAVGAVQESFLVVAD